MTVRENVHQFIDMLPEDRLDDVLDYLTELSEGDEELAEDPYNPRLSAPLSGPRSVAQIPRGRVANHLLVAGYQVREDGRIVFVAMIERRGQVSNRV